MQTRKQERWIMHNIHGIQIIYAECKHETGGVGSIQNSTHPLSSWVPKCFSISWSILWNITSTSCIHEHVCDHAIYIVRPASAWTSVFAANLPHKSSEGHTTDLILFCWRFNKGSTPLAGQFLSHFICHHSEHRGRSWLLQIAANWYHIIPLHVQVLLVPY